MNTNTNMKMGECDRFRDCLIDYADEVLRDEEAARLEEHLGECGSCRGEVKALRRSLCLAQSVWQESTARTPRTTAPIPHSKRWSWSAAAVAGAAALVTLAVGIHRIETGTDIPAGKTGDPASAANDVALRDSGPTTEELDVETYIRRSEQSARLAASVRLLSAQPLAQHDAQRAQHYLRTTYGHVDTRVPNTESSDL